MTYITLIPGDDYYTVDNRALRFVSDPLDTPPDMDGADATFNVTNLGGDAVAATGVAVAYLTDNAIEVAVELDADETMKLARGRSYRYTLIVTLANGHVVTLITGRIITPN